MRGLFSILLLVLLTLGSQAQQAPVGIKPPGSNPVLHGYTRPQTQAKATTNTPLTLPFIEDFSYAKPGWPNPALFVDTFVYVNPDFGIDPPTIGVATFDGLNANGFPYVLQVNPQPTGQADFLTSQPIDLASNTPADSVYFSFFYQPEGLGDAPEFTNVLELFFRNKSTNNYDLVWSAEGQTLAEFDTLYGFKFKVVNIALTDTNYLWDNFQFQFRNNASQNGGYDHWNIDYLYLDKNRNRFDTVFADVGFVYKAPSMLRDYEAMPFNQYSNLDFSSKIKLFQNNIGTADQNCDYVYDGPYSVGCGQTIGPSAPLASFWTNGYNTFAAQSDPDLIGCGYPNPLPDTVTFKLSHVFTSQGGANNFITRNDTILRNQRFADFYAYDDGTAEAAFFIQAPGGGYCAVRYELNTPDVLRAVHFQFQQYQVNVSTNDFCLIVCSPDPNNDDLPGDTIFSQCDLNAEYLPYHNGFVTYVLNQPVNLPVGNFFVGWYQPEEFTLNVGFDRNTDHSQQTFVRVLANGWQQSPIPGSLMLRPVVGDSIIDPASVNNPVVVAPRATLQASVYPNPANNVVFIKHNATQPLNYVLYNMQGLAIAQGIVTPEGIDTQTLSNGLYYLHLSNGSQRLSRKLCIAR